MTEYNMTAAFKAIEDELISSMIRNMDRHRAEETKEGIQWTQWQTEQLKSLERYKQKNRKKYGAEFASLNQQMEDLIRTAKQKGSMKQEVRILQAIKKGYKVLGKNAGSAGGMSAEFFKLNERKLEALIKATTHDMKKAETAVLRMANDQYRKAIFNAQVYANSGAGTYERAVDMATKDMLSAGLNCVEYKNGARHTLADYADMAIRTSSKRAYLQGEGEKRQEWGISTVIMNKRGNPCPKCLPFVGKVLIDDVWSGGSAGDGTYPLMSTAIAAGLYHPRCEDSHTTYFPDISTPDDTWTPEEIKAVDKHNKQEAEQQYAERQSEKFGRLAAYSLDEENKKQYGRKAERWKTVAKTAETDIIKLSDNEQAALNKYISSESYTLNDKLRRNELLSEADEKLIKDLDGALDKMPEYAGILRRSVSEFGISNLDEFVKSHVVGQQKSFSSYISTSRSIYDDSFPIQYIIQSKHGKDIRAYNPEEKEILFKRDTKFWVTKIDDNTIYMEEV